jgi:hypothetical protein
METPGARAKNDSLIRDQKAPDVTSIVSNAVAREF